MEWRNPEAVVAVRSEHFRVRRVLLAAFFTICLAAFSDAGGAKGKNATIPLWTANVIEDLRDAGRNRPGIAFLDDNRIIVYNVALDTSELSSRANADASSPFLLQASVIDVRSGKIVNTKEWRTRHDGSLVQVTSGGVVVRTGDIIRFCSKNLVEIRRDVVFADPNDGLEIRTSTTGKTVLLNHYHINPQGRVGSSGMEVLNGDTLEPILNWVQSPGIIDKYAITDEIIASNRYENVHGTVVATKFGSGAWFPLFRLSSDVCSPGQSGVFVTENALVCVSRNFVVSSTTGQILMNAPLDKADGKGTQIAVSRNSRYVAVLLEKFRDLWDTGGHITSLRAAVYELAMRQRVMTVVVSPLPKHDYGIALSPDGSELAILSDGTVSMYSVGLAHNAR